MKRVFLVAVAVMVGFVGRVTSQEYVSVTGRSEVMVTPDRFTLSVVIDEVATKGRVSISELEGEMVKSLKAAGIETKESLTMSGVASRVAKRNDASGVARYRLTLSSSEEVSASVEALKGVGISSVELVASTHSQLDEYISQAGCSALLDARRRATALAEAVGQGVGEAIQINDESAYYENIMPIGHPRGALMADNGGVHTPLSISDIKISGRVTARFRLLPEGGE